MLLEISEFVNVTYGVYKQWTTPWLQSSWFVVAVVVSGSAISTDVWDPCNLYKRKGCLAPEDSTGHLTDYCTRWCLGDRTTIIITCLSPSSISTNALPDIRDS